MQQDFHQAEQRVRRYWYSDGIVNCAGGMFICWSVFCAAGVSGRRFPLTAILRPA
jgi:hypothetical protein